MRRSRMKIAPAVPIRKKLIRDVVNNNPDAQSVADDKKSLEIKTELLQQCDILTKDDIKVDVEVVPNEADKVVDTSSSSAATTVNTTPEQVVDPQKSPLVTITEAAVSLLVSDDKKTDEIVSETLKQPDAIIKDDLKVDLEAGPNVADDVINTSSSSTVNTIEKINDTPKSPEKLPSQSPVKENIFERPKSPVKEFKELSKSSTVTTVPKTIDQTSPVKFFTNRTGFVRPSPKFDGPSRIRRNSVHGSGASASESEDDSRRQNSTIQKKGKNDSDSTSQADKASINNENNNKSSDCYNKNGRKKKKMVVSESVRKLMESRREFNRLYGDKKPPDTKKLKMYDLIYYNPTANPMKKKGRGQGNTSDKSKDAEEDTDDKNEEAVDDPEAEAAAADIPVPQVKVGPNGELIIDDQSLIIKNSDVDRERERISRKRALVDDESRMAGFYKRRTKSKDWVRNDTIKFYKALSTIGTDFLIMKSFFPDRTRQNIKMKFKKEERQNKELVDKALSTGDFDLDKLKKDFEECDKEKKIQEEEKERLRLNQQNKAASKKGRKKYPSMAVSAIPVVDADEDEEGDANNNEENKNIKKKDKKKPSNIKKKYKRIIKPKESDDDDGDDEDDHDKNDTETTGVSKQKKTRSGRLSSTTKKLTSNCRTILDEIFDKDDNIIDENAKEPITSIESIQESVTEIQNAVPGSFVVVSKDCPIEPGKKLLEVYLVSDAEAQSDCDHVDESPINNNNIIEKTLTDEITTSG
ncbi:hypothetical protein HCN44_009585 [Aphidius gifuensis]|uniref:Transcription factor TFIIIB component B'' Myb domain-containing protein n=1 Tax=Aphidius gifuensis TaxID=684658 RepID=A0A834Y5D7_APHGI|nr:transcription factor TFIIIB component B'' [Aphidius gifuensis]KAF7998187.1 hypothetical protein HCN44_009585 [Aphidius gifuensis]